MAGNLISKTLAASTLAEEKANMINPRLEGHRTDSKNIVDEAYADTEKIFSLNKQLLELQKAQTNDAAQKLDYLLNLTANKINPHGLNVAKTKSLGEYKKDVYDVNQPFEESANSLKNLSNYQNFESERIKTFMKSYSAKQNLEEEAIATEIKALKLKQEEEDVLARKKSEEDGLYSKMVRNDLQKAFGAVGEQYTPDLRSKAITTDPWDGAAAVGLDILAGGAGITGSVIGAIGDVAEGAGRFAYNLATGEENPWDKAIKDTKESDTEFAHLGLNKVSDYLNKKAKDINYRALVDTEMLGRLKDEEGYFSSSMLGGVKQAITDTVITSLPEMGLVATPFGVLGLAGSKAHQMARENAENEGKDTSKGLGLLSDIGPERGLYAGFYAGLSKYGEWQGVKNLGTTGKLFGKTGEEVLKNVKSPKITSMAGKSVDKLFGEGKKAAAIKGAGKAIKGASKILGTTAGAALGEAGVEYLQTQLELLGSNPKMSPYERHKLSKEAAIMGGIAGGGIGGGISLVGKTYQGAKSILNPEKDLNDPKTYIAKDSSVNSANIKDMNAFVDSFDTNYRENKEKFSKGMSEDDVITADTVVKNIDVVKDKFSSLDINDSEKVDELNGILDTMASDLKLNTKQATAFKKTMISKYGSKDMNQQSRQELLAKFNLLDDEQGVDDLLKNENVDQSYIKSFKNHLQNGTIKDEKQKAQIYNKVATKMKDYIDEMRQANVPEDNIQAQQGMLVNIQEMIKSTSDVVEFLKALNRINKDNTFQSPGTNLDQYSFDDMKNVVKNIYKDNPAMSDTLLKVMDMYKQLEDSGRSENLLKGGMSKSRRIFGSKVRVDGLESYYKKILDGKPLENKEVDHLKDFIKHKNKQLNGEINIRAGGKEATLEKGSKLAETIQFERDWLQSLADVNEDLKKLNKEKDVKFKINPKQDTPEEESAKEEAQTKEEPKEDLQEIKKEAEEISKNTQKPQKESKQEDKEESNDEKETKVEEKDLDSLDVNNLTLDSNLDNETDSNIEEVKDSGVSADIGEQDFMNKVSNGSNAVKDKVQAIWSKFKSLAKFGSNAKEVDQSSVVPKSLFKIAKVIGITKADIYNTMLDPKMLEKSEDNIGEYDLFNFFADKTGKVNKAFQDSLNHAMIETILNSHMFSTEQALQEYYVNYFGMREYERIPAHQLQDIKNIRFRDALQESLANIMMRDLDIKLKKNASLDEKNEFAKFKNSLGFFAVETMINKRLITPIAGVREQDNYNRITNIFTSLAKKGERSSKFGKGVKLLRINIPGVLEQGLKDNRVNLTKDMYSWLNAYDNQNVKDVIVGEKPKWQSIKQQKNFLHSAPKLVHKAINKLQQTPYVANTKAINAFKNIISSPKYRLLAMKQLGYIHPRSEEYAKSSQVKKDSIDAKNDSIIKSIDNIAQREDILDNDLYFRAKMWINGRIGIDSNTINPQSDKLHRFLVVRKDQLERAFLSTKNTEAINAIKAIGLAFKIEFDKSSTKAYIEKFNDNLKAKFSLTDDFIKLNDKNEFESFNYEYLASDEFAKVIKQMKEYVFKGDVVEFGLSLNNVIALEEIHNQLKKDVSKRSFKDVVFLSELDGVTNGIILKSGLMPVAPFKEHDKIMSRGGVLSSDNGYSDIGEYFEAGNEDIYKSVARSFTNKVGKDMKSALASLGVDLVDKDNLITKAGRNLFKPIVMVFGYGAGLQSIISKFNFTVKEAYQEQVAKIVYDVKSNKANLEQASKDIANLSEAYYTVLRNEKPDKLMQDRIRSFIVPLMFGKNNNDSILEKDVLSELENDNSWLNPYHNNSEEDSLASMKDKKLLFEGVLRDIFPNIAELNTSINSFARELYNYLFVDSKSKEGKIQRESLMTRLNKAVKDKYKEGKFTQDIPNLLITKDMSYEEAYNNLISKYLPQVAIMERYQDDFTIPVFTKSKEVMRDSEGKLLTHKSKVKGNNNKSIIASHNNNVWGNSYGNPRSAYGAIQNHSLDGMIMASLANFFEGKLSQVFDAAVVTQAEADKVGKAYNTIFGLTIKNINPLDNMIKLYENLPGVKDLDEFKDLVNWTQEVRKNKEEIYSKDHIISQLAGASEIGNPVVLKGSKKALKKEEISKQEEEKDSVVEDSSNDPIAKDIVDKFKSIFNTSLAHAKEFYDKNNNNKTSFESFLKENKSSDNIDINDLYHEVAVKIDSELASQITGRSIVHKRQLVGSLGKDKLGIDEFYDPILDYYLDNVANKQKFNPEKRSVDNTYKSPSVDEQIDKEVETLSKIELDNDNATAHEIYNQAEEIDKEQANDVSDTHKEHLRGIIDSFVSASKKFIPKMNVILSQSNASTNGGLFNLTTRTLNLIKAKTSTFIGGMSMQETYAHELIHSSTVYAMLNHRDKIGHELRLATKLHGMVIKDLKVENLLPSDPRQVDIDLANDIIKHLSSRNGIEELLAIGLSNERLGEYLKTIKLDKLAPKGVFSVLQDVFNKIMNIFSGKEPFDVKDKNGLDALQYLAQSIAKANNEVQSTHGSLRNNISKVSLDLLAPLDKAVSAKIKDLRKDYTIEKGMTFKNIDPKDVGVASSIKNIFHNAVLTSNDPKAMKLFRDTMADLYTHTWDYKGTIQSVLDHVTDPDSLRRGAQKLQAISSRIDAFRNAVKQTISKSMEEEFKTPLDKTTKQSLGRAILYTDISSVDISLDELKELVDDSSKLDSELDSRWEDIKSLISKAYNSKQNIENYLKVEAVNLAKFMTEGTTNINAQYLNTKNMLEVPQISSHVTNAKEVDNLHKALDEYVSLVALRFSQMSSLRALSEAIAKDKEALEFVFRSHRLFKDNSRETVLKGALSNEIKGYTVENYGKQVDIRIDMKEKESEYLLKGYKAIKELNEGRMLYYNSYSPDVKFARTATRLINESARGTTIEDMYQMERANMDLNAQNKRKARLDKENKEYNQSINTLLNTKSKPAPIKDIFGGYKEFNDKMVPIMDLEGFTKDFRFNLSKSSKENLLLMDTDIFETLGSMHAANLDKVQSIKHNKAVADLIIQDHKQNHTKDPKNYIEVSNESQDYEAREIYKMIPYDMRKTLEEYFDNTPIQIRRDMLSKYFGYRKLSMTNFKIYKALKSANKRRAIQIAEEIIRSVVRTDKATIVLKTLSVVRDNIISNTLMLVNNGVNIVDVWKDQFEGIKFLDEYRNTRKEIIKLEHLAKSGHRVDERLEVLKNNLKKSPVAPLIEAGLFTNIVEDLENVEYSRAEEWARERSYDKMPKLGQNIFNNIYLTSNSYIGEKLIKITQYSDFVARYTQYKKNKDIGMDEEANINMLRDQFIDYDLPTSRTDDFLQGMGVFYFTRYLVRIQRPLTNLAGEKPVSTALLQFLANLFNLPTAYDTFLPNKILNGSFDNYFKNPMEYIEETLVNVIRPDIFDMQIDLKKNGYL